MLRYGINHTYTIKRPREPFVKHCDLKILYEDLDGIIDINKILVENGANSDYFISGALAMIKMFNENLKKSGVLPVNIITDEWE